MSQQQVQGFINVKIPSRIKSRNFIPWKAWKRQWVVIRRSRDNRSGVELSIGRNSQTTFQISSDVLICRTESRTQYYAFGIFPQQNKRRASIYLAGTSETDSQKWISTIRNLLKPPLLPVEENEFSVSVIDNFFSRSAGLCGLYGTLRMSADHVTIIDPFTSKSKAKWPWTTLAQFHVSSTIACEDKGHICTIVTSRAFPSGIGPIHLFCTESVELIKKLQSKGRPSSLSSSSAETVSFRHHTFSCSSSNSNSSSSFSTPLSSSHATLEKSLLLRKPFLSRRLSRSEGNLMSALRQFDTSLYGFLDRGSPCLNSLDDKIFVESNEYFLCQGKVAPGIISAGLGLILSTPGGSEGDSESLHEYERLQGDSDDDMPSFPFTMALKTLSPPRRVSGISIASGVYEEIDDVTINLDFSSLDMVNECEAEPPPPPLPPRRKISSKTMVDEVTRAECGDFLSVPSFPNTFLSRSEGSTPVNSPIPCPYRSLTAPPSPQALYSKSSSWRGECDYLPMLPSCGLFGEPSKTEFASKETLEDQHYMVMASIKVLSNVILADKDTNILYKIYNSPDGHFQLRQTVLLSLKACCKGNVKLYYEADVL